MAGDAVAVSGSVAGNTVNAAASATAAPPFFEGTEKRVEVDFAGDGSLRHVPRSGWEDVVGRSQTRILNHCKTDEFESFLLSESSLIVYDRKVILKTCGNTVPIRSIDTVLKLAASMDLQPEWLSYSRKNFLAPVKQPAEHQSREAEIALCRDACGGAGDAYVLGQLTGDHWLLYNRDFQWTDCSERADYQLDIMMYELPEDVRQVFHTSEPEGSRSGAEAMTQCSGLGAVAASIRGEVEDYCFAPCGYSCNIHAGDAYAMVHVTPQEECSYASFETNYGSSRAPGALRGNVSSNLNTLVDSVLQVFKPQRFTMTLFFDDGASAAIGGAPFEEAARRYRRKTHTCTRFEQDYGVTIGVYTLASSASSPPRSRASTQVEPTEASAKLVPPIQADEEVEWGSDRLLHWLSSQGGVSKDGLESLKCMRLDGAMFLAASDDDWHNEELGLEELDVPRLIELRSQFQEARSLQK